MFSNAEKCRLYYIRHRAERIEHQKRYYEQHRAERLQYATGYGFRFREQLKEKTKAYRDKNLDRIREYDRKRSSQPKRRNQAQATYLRHWQSRRARMRKANAEKVREAKSFFGNKCLLCRHDSIPEILEFDHKKPIKTRRRKSDDRGVYVLKNPDKFALLCPNCHTIKTLIETRSYPPSKSAIKQRRARKGLVDKFGGCCKRCDYRECYLALEFDHIVPIRRSNRTALGNFHEANRYPERFQLLCANCHAIKTLGLLEFACFTEHETCASA